MFLSKAPSSSPLIDDRNYLQFVTEPPGMSRGREPRDYGKNPYGSRCAKFEDKFEEIPRSDWAEIIEEQTKKKTRLIDQVRGYKELFALDQNGTNFCWGNAPTMGAMILRRLQGLKPIRLSPASVCAKIKNYRNEGGWGAEACDFAAEHGWVPSSLWPDNAIQRKYDTPENRKMAMNFRLVERVDMAARSIGQMTTAILRGFPVPVGYNWWGHEVLAVGVGVAGRNSFWWDILNSWSPQWGDHGFGRLAESKAIPDDQVMMRQMLSYIG